MKIGTDSISECRDSGYMVIDFKVKSLYPNGRKNGIDKDCEVRATVSFEGSWIKGHFQPWLNLPQYMTDTFVSWNDLIGIFQDMGMTQPGFLSSCDRKSPETIENPTEYDLLNLASDICSYQGLD